MADIVDLEGLLEKIPGGEGAGSDPSQEPEYEEIRNEIDKLTNPNSDGQVDWHKVEALATTILLSKAKDLLVGTWLAVALIETRGILGLGFGIRILEGLTLNYWDIMFPPIKRIRGRRNAIDWWQGRAKDWLQTAVPGPIFTSEHTEFLEALSSLDKGLSEKDSEAPTLVELANYFKRVDTLPDPVEAQEINTEALEEVAEDLSVDEAVDAAPAQAEPQSSDGHAEAQKPPPVSSAPVGAALASNDIRINGLTDIPTALLPAQDYLGRVSDQIRALDPFNPLVARLNRFASRSAILALPPAQASTTRIPSPKGVAYDSVIEAGNPEAIFNFCESRITASPFWLDLDMHSVRALQTLGANAAPVRQAIIDEVLSFLQRLPGLDQLKFDDGTPFASPETKSWIESCLAERSGGGGVDAFSVCEREAMQAFSEGDVEGAMDVYQAFIDKTRAGRDQFRARIALVGLLMDSRDDVDAMPYIDPIIEQAEAQAQTLRDWEPELLFSAFAFRLRALKEKLTRLEKSRDDEAGILIKAVRVEVDSTLRKMAFLNFPDTVRQDLPLE